MRKLAVAAAAGLVLLPGAGQAAAPGGGRLQPVPILMYHVITAPPKGVAYPGLYVRSRDFAAQVAWLAAHGFHGVTLQQVFDGWRGAAHLPAHPIVFSFDDGSRSQLVNAFPVLRARGWPGVLNLELGHLTSFWGMPPPAVRRLIAAGWEIDSHTINHPDLTTLDPQRLRAEVTGSRQRLRRLFHVPANFFCYPSGRYNSAVIAAVQAAGYYGATSTEYGLARPSDLYALDRVRVDGADRVSDFAAKIKALTGR